MLYVLDGPIFSSYTEAFAVMGAVFGILGLTFGLLLFFKFMATGSI